MCGIIGYIGKKNAVPILLRGLDSLEYRGYDSAGICFGSNDLIRIRAKGQVSVLRSRVGDDKKSNRGIAHTRWATHGEPNENNSHPHMDCKKNIAVVHNGIIENFIELKKELSENHKFESQTDSEILAHLIEEEVSNSVQLKDAVIKALKRVKGTYGIAVISNQEPNKIIVARMGSPLAVVKDDTGIYIASDSNALAPYSSEVIYLEDGDIAVLEADNYKIIQNDNVEIDREVYKIDYSPEQTQKNGYDYFMAKEMHEQADVILESIRGRLVFSEARAVLGGLKNIEKELSHIKRLTIVACGSAYYAAMVGKYMIENMTGLPVDIDTASEFRYRKRRLSNDTAVLFVSQSGETADTLAALRDVKSYGILTLGLVNVVGSSIARETDAGIYSHAGPELAVASTKAFISQITIFVLLGLWFGRKREMSDNLAYQITDKMKNISDMVTRILSKEKKIERIASLYSKISDCYFLGRGALLPIAYEGALKLKEISYIHAEGYPSGEMKHGPIVLIDNKFVSLILLKDDSLFEKTTSTIQEIKARGGRVIIISDAREEKVKNLGDDYFIIPKVSDLISPLLFTIPLQLFAYYMAVSKGLNPDRPRNLAKSVTVE